MASYSKCSRSHVIFFVFYVFLLTISSQIYFQMSVIIEMEPSISLANLPPDIKKRIIEMEKESLDEIGLLLLLLPNWSIAPLYVFIYRF